MGDHHLSIRYGAASKESHVEEPSIEEEAQSTSTGHDTSPTAPEDLRCTDHCEQGTPKVGERERQPTEYVVDRVINSKIDGLRTLYRVSWYGYGPKANIWEPTQHSPQHLIVRCKQRLHKKRRGTQQ